MSKENIPFVGLHAHSVAGSIFDGLGYPQEHMDFAYENGMDALALTDHGNMNGLAWQVLHAKKMQAEGKDFKPIFGCEAYFVPSIAEWREDYEKIMQDKKAARAAKKSETSGATVEDEGESKKATRNILNRRRHLVLLVQNEGIIASSACLGGVYAGCYWENREEGPEAVLDAMRSVTARMQSIFGDRWYGELQWNNIPEQHELNKYIIQVCEGYGVEMISMLGVTGSFTSALVGLARAGPLGAAMGNFPLTLTKLDMNCILRTATKCGSLIRSIPRLAT